MANVDLVKYLSGVMRWDVNNQPFVPMFDRQYSDDQPQKVSLKEHFLVESSFSLSLDEVI